MNIIKPGQLELINLTNYCATHDLKEREEMLLEILLWAKTTAEETTPGLKFTKTQAEMFLILGVTPS